MDMIIPVIDLKDGIAVSGKSGKRETYKPLKTVFHNSSDPIAISIALKEAGFKRIYVADLDAIEDKGLNLKVVREMNNIIPVMLDSGLNSFDDAENILDTVEKVIIATETINSLEDLKLLFSFFPKQNLVMSVDVKEGNVLCKHINTDFEDVIKIIKEIKPLEVILLDVSRVGTEKGFNHDLVNRFIDLETSLILGGGVRDQDILELTEMGIKNFLVGTALHSGIFNNPL
jgi:phosphoribosylformimino-5-aminoimidazole carboxamide ribotide isomerase